MKGSICLVFGIAVAMRSEKILNLKVSDIEIKEAILVLHITKSKTNMPRMFDYSRAYSAKLPTIYICQNHHYNIWNIILVEHTLLSFFPNLRADERHNCKVLC